MSENGRRGDERRERRGGREEERKERGRIKNYKLKKKIIFIDRTEKSVLIRKADILIAFVYSYVKNSFNRIKKRERNKREAKKER